MAASAKIANSVGIGGVNRPTDVAVVQYILDNYLDRQNAPKYQGVFTEGLGALPPLTAPLPPGASLPPLVFDAPSLSTPPLRTPSLFDSPAPIFPWSLFSKRFVIDGWCDNDLGDATREFQTTVLKMKVPDGLLAPHGMTFKAMLDYCPSDPVPPVLRGEASTELWGKLNGENFAQLYEREFGPLATDRREGLKRLHDAIVADPDVYDIRWGAYMLATAK